jgi:CHAT domain-containing protein
MLALGLDNHGTQQFLTPYQIASSRTDIGVVTLSGCHSGWGRTAPGAGLLGLTRAWLQSGARAVIATHWPVQDDDGALFAAYYSALSATSPVEGDRSAIALRQAQTAALASGGWHSSPRYWATYFQVSKGTID